MKINYIDSEPQTIRVIYIDKEMEEAHNDFNNRKRDVLFKIEEMWDNDETPAIYRRWLEDIHKFILEEVK